MRGLGIIFLALVAPALSHAEEAVDLRLKAPVLHCSPLIIDAAPADAEPVTAYLGPTVVDGIYARIIDRLPAKMRRTVESPVGVEPLFLLAGAGLGLYVRLPR